MTTIDAPATLSPTDLRRLYEQMVLIRVFETESERQYKAAKIGGYCHLSSGQEAATVGVVHTMQEDDLLVTGYRCHGFALARGVSPEAVMAELFGRADGCAHGRGGSMHLLDVDRGFYGGWGIVGGQLPVATGLALALVRARQGAGRGLRARRRRRSTWAPGTSRSTSPRCGTCRSSSSSSTTATAWARASQRASAEPELYRRASRLPDARRARRRRRPRGGRRGLRPAAQARPRGARAGRARGRHLPLPRPLGGRRRARLPDQGGDRRRKQADDPIARLRRHAARARRDRRGARRASTATSTSAWPRRSRSPTPARSPT